MPSQSVFLKRENCSRHLELVCRDLFLQVDMLRDYDCSPWAISQLDVMIYYDHTRFQNREGEASISSNFQGWFLKAFYFEWPFGMLQPAPRVKLHATWLKTTCPMAHLWDGCNHRWNAQKATTNAPVGEPQWSFLRKDDGTWEPWVCHSQLSFFAVWMWP